MSNTQPKREEYVKKQHAFLVGEDEAAPTAALERQIGNGIDDLIEDDAADPQLAKHPRLVAEKERRDDVVPPRDSLGSDLGVLVVVLVVVRFLCCRFEGRLLDCLKKACSCVCVCGGLCGVVCGAHRVCE